MKSSPIFWSLLLAVISLWANGQPKGELFYSSDAPLGNIAVSRSDNSAMQYFITLHPEGKPKGAKVFELVDGKIEAFPDSVFQDQFNSPLGIYLDRKHRLWVLDHGSYGLKSPRLFAFDASTGEVLVDYHFEKEVVKKWVMLNDLSVTPDGNFVIISAPGMFKKKSSIVVFDVKNLSARSVLTDHSSVMRKKILPEVDGKKMRFFLGLIKVQPGVDGIDIDPWGKYVYYAALADTILYRIPVDAITDPELNDEALGKLVQSIGNRPLTDGLRVDEKKLVYLTDFQHHSILAMDPGGATKIILQDKNIRWADGLSIGKDGYLYITDSALQHVIRKKEKKYSQYKPFGLYRIKIQSN